MTAAAAAATPTPSFLDAEQEREEGVSTYMKMTLPSAPKLKISDLKSMADTSIPDIVMYAKLKQILQSDTEYAFSASRILIEHFGAKQVDLHGEQRIVKDSSSKSMYEKVRRALLRLNKEGIVEMRKLGVTSYFWLKQQQQQEQQ
jgi:hypothetical protein